LSPNGRVKAQICFIFRILVKKRRKIQEERRSLQLPLNQKLDKLLLSKMDLVLLLILLLLPLLKNQELLRKQKPLPLQLKNVITLILNFMLLISHSPSLMMN